MTSRAGPLPVSTTPTCRVHSGGATGLRQTHNARLGQHSQPRRPLCWQLGHIQARLLQHRPGTVLASEVRAVGVVASGSATAPSTLSGSCCNPPERRRPRESLVALEAHLLAEELLAGLALKLGLDGKPIAIRSRLRHPRVSSLSFRILLTPAGNRIFFFSQRLPPLAHWPACCASSSACPTCLLQRPLRSWRVRAG